MPRSPFDALSYLVPFSQVGLYGENPSTGVVEPPPPPPPLLPPIGQQAQLPGTQTQQPDYMSSGMPFPGQYDEKGNQQAQLPGQGKKPVVVSEGGYDWTWEETYPATSTQPAIGKWVRLGRTAEPKQEKVKEPKYGVTKVPAPDGSGGTWLVQTANGVPIQDETGSYTNVYGIVPAKPDRLTVREADDGGLVVVNMDTKETKYIPPPPEVKAQKEAEAKAKQTVAEQNLALKNKEFGLKEREYFDTRARQSWLDSSNAAKDFTEKREALKKENETLDEKFGRFKEYVFSNWASGNPNRNPTWAEWLKKEKPNEAPWWYGLPGGLQMANRQRDWWNSQVQKGIPYDPRNPGPLLNTRQIEAANIANISQNPKEPIPEAPESYAQWGRPGFKSLPEAQASGLFDPIKLAFGVAERIPGSGQLPGGGWMGGSREAEIKIRADAEQAKKVQEAEQNALSSWDRMVRRARSSPYPGFRP